MEELGKDENGLEEELNSSLIRECEMSKVIINLTKYKKNLSAVKRIVGKDRKVIAVVKANAYGHGLVQLAKVAESDGVDMFGVANVEEGVKLRDSGIKKPILILLQPNEDEIGELIQYNLTPLISEFDFARKLSEEATKLRKIVKVHCKVDTGMGRQGIHIDYAPKEIRNIVHLPSIDLEGVATHFPCAEIENDGFTENQISIFSKLLEDLGKAGIPYELAHCANSAGIINYPSSYFDAVRPGIITYGVLPVNNSKARELVSPILRWESKIIQVKTIPKGFTIGYGRTFEAPYDMNVAIVPVGYADGFKLSLSNKGEVLIGGVRCPVRGNVSMDQIVVELKTNKLVKSGDPVVIIGKDGDDEITVEEMAQKAGTIPYDILTGIGARVKREYEETGG
ncbi:MAG: alanine racemase [Candidatus Hydrogenedentes bacterium]|nr:alanine racemase [Candidatus Hydrogenedentota bacterium]